MISTAEPIVLDYYKLQELQSMFCYEDIQWESGWQGRSDGGISVYIPTQNQST